MAGNNDEAGDKIHEPTPRKLEEARKKGEIARAPDLTAAAAYLGLFGGAAVLGAPAIRGFGDALLPFLEQPDRLAAGFTDGSGMANGGGVLLAVTMPVLPLFLAPAAMVLVALFATRGLLFTPSKLAFKASRLSPIENAKNKFGRRGLFEFLKSFVKLAVYAIVLALFLRGRLDEIVG